MLAGNLDNLRWSASTLEAPEDFSGGRSQVPAELTVALEHDRKSRNDLAHLDLLTCPQAELNEDSEPWQNSIENRRALLELGLGDGPQTTRPVIAPRLAKAPLAKCLQSRGTLVWAIALYPE